MDAESGEDEKLSWMYPVLTWTASWKHRTGLSAGLPGCFPRQDGHEWRPVPGLELGAPEVRVIPDRLKISDSGITARDLALTIDTFNDGPAGDTVHH